MKMLIRNLFFVTLFILITITQTQASNAIIGQGCLVYPFGDNQMVVWSDLSTCSGVGFGGLITETSIIKIYGEEVSRKSLKIHNNQKVLYRLIYRIEGEGETLKLYIEKFEIFR